MLCERGSAHEEGSAGADGPGVSVSTADGAHYCEGRRRKDRRKDRGQQLNGSKGTSLRIPAGRHQDVAVAMVRQAGLREAAARGPGVEGRATEPFEGGGHQLD